MIAGRARREGARLDPQRSRRRDRRDGGADLVTFTTPTGDAAPTCAWRCAGAHQVDNAAVALGLLDELDALGFATPTTARPRGPVGSRVARTSRALHGRRLHVLARRRAQSRPARARWRRTCGRPAQGVDAGLRRDERQGGRRDARRALAPVAALTICTTAPTPRAMGPPRWPTLARLDRTRGSRSSRIRFAALARAPATAARPGRRGRLDLPRRAGPRAAGP